MNDCISANLDCIRIVKSISIVSGSYFAVATYKIEKFLLYFAILRNGQDEYSIALNNFTYTRTRVRTSTRNSQS